MLSIDGFKGNAGGEKFQCIIADAANHRPVDILPNRKKSELIRYFCGFESRKDVKYVVIDMNTQFRDVAEICFPNATTVIDRFHVTRQALWAMERVRKAEQKALPAAWRKFFQEVKIPAVYTARRA
ncbi:MAG: transposase [Oscillospiraceae bacterium]|nr:transposase [Oscillospiraceae bacterium]